MNWRGKIPAFCFALAMIAAACGDSGTSTETADDTNTEAESAASDTATESDNSAESADDAETVDDAEAVTSTTATPTTVEETTTSVAAPEALAQVTLLDAGSEPRTELVLDIPDGTTETMVMTQNQTLVQELDGQTLQNLVVSIVTKQELVTTAIDGGYRVVGTITSSEAGPDADPVTADQMNTELQAMVGVTTETEIDNRGSLLRAEVGGDGGLDQATQELMQSASQVSVPFPAEPVGVGAQWEVVQAINLGGIDTTQTSVYTLTEVEGSIVTIETATEQNVEPGSILSQGGVDIEVASWSNVGKGTMVMDLTSMVPTSAAVSAAVQELLIPGSNDPLLQTVEVTIEIGAE